MTEAAQPRLASRMDRLGTETAFRVLVAAKALEAQGHDIIHLEIGEPDFKTPGNVVDAGVAAMRDGKTGYTGSAGIVELREAVAEETARTRGISVNPDQVVITPGAKPIIYHAAFALLEEGDEAITPNPGFPIYESAIEFAGATAVPLPLSADQRFACDPDALLSLVTERTRLVILNSPHNPTGAVTSQEDFARIAAGLADRPDIWVLSDEIYSRIYFDGGNHSSIASCEGMEDRLIILDGASKTWSMTGWRLGWGVMPASLAVHIANLNTNSVSCTANFVQWAGIEALQGPQDAAAAMVAAYERRRDFMCEALGAMPGFRAFKPAGAFYLWVDVKETGIPCDELQARILDECHVACLSGTAFGAHGEGFIRFACTNSLERTAEALERIAVWRNA